MKKLLCCMTAIMLAFTLTGCSSDNEEEKEQKTEFAVNEVATFDDVNFIITNVEKHQGKTEFVKPADGKEYVTVTIKIENKSDEKIDYNPLYWKMVNASGQEESQCYAGSIDNELHSGNLDKGGVIEGTITFEEPVGDTGLKLNYYDNLFDKEATCSFIIG